MSEIQKNLEAASEKYSSSFTKGHLALPPAKKYLVLTCMDARIDPAQAFGIDLGDAHVIRNVIEQPPSERSTLKAIAGRSICSRCIAQHRNLRTASRHAGDSVSQTYWMRYVDVQK